MREPALSGYEMIPVTSCEGLLVTLHRYQEPEILVIIARGYSSQSCKGVVRRVHDVGVATQRVGRWEQAVFKMAVVI